ncbi:MAG: hypothetical protein HZA48_04305 [Planctomycetes bacterium]|nr:hypothetical protein [Planctomycetota bacterium]
MGLFDTYYMATFEGNTIQVKTKVIIAAATHTLYINGEKADESTLAATDECSITGKLVDRKGAVRTAVVSITPGAFSSDYDLEIDGADITMIKTDKLIESSKPAVKKQVLSVPVEISGSKIKCPKCGVENDASAVSCSMCSTPFQTAPKELPAKARPLPPVKYPLAAVTAGLFFGGLVLTFLPLFLFHYWSDKTGALAGAGAIVLFVIIIKLFQESIKGAVKYAIAVSASVAGIGIGMFLFGFCISDWSYSFFSTESQPHVNMGLLGDERSYEGFSVRPPSGWGEATGRPNAKIFFQDNNDFNGFYPSICVNSEKFSESIVESAMFTTGEKILKKKLPDCDFKEKSICNIGGKSACRLVVTYKSGETAMKVMFVFIEHGKETWCLMCTAPAEKYDEYRDIFYSFANSLKIY